MKVRTLGKLMADGETEASIKQQLDEHQVEKDRWAGNERAAAQWCDRQNRLIGELNRFRTRS